MLDVLSIAKENEILWSVVGPNSVDVMNDFASSEFPSDNRLHDNPVLVKSTVLGKDCDIAIGFNGSIADGILPSCFSLFGDRLLGLALS